MDPKQQAQKAQEKQQWAGIDPFTLVSSVREALYTIPTNHRSEIEGPIEEVLARFDQSQRAGLGSSLAPAVGAGMSSGSGQ